MSEPAWNLVSYPIVPQDDLPPERKVVAVWCGGHRACGEDVGHAALPYLGYIRYAAGDRRCPFFVVYHGSQERPVDVIAWCDCLPNNGPEGVDTATYYTQRQSGGSGFPARRGEHPISL